MPTFEVDTPNILLQYKHADSQHDDMSCNTQTQKMGFAVICTSHIIKKQVVMVYLKKSAWTLLFHILLHPPFPPSQATLAINTAASITATSTPLLLLMLTLLLLLPFQFLPLLSLLLSPPLPSSSHFSARHVGTTH